MRVIEWINVDSGRKRVYICVRGKREREREREKSVRVISDHIIGEVYVSLMFFVPNSQEPFDTAGSGATPDFVKVSRLPK